MSVRQSSLKQNGAAAKQPSLREQPAIVTSQMVSGGYLSLAQIVTTESGLDG
jgi:hypothetical protein